MIEKHHRGCESANDKAGKSHSLTRVRIVVGCNQSCMSVERSVLAGPVVFVFVLPAQSPMPLVVSVSLDEAVRGDAVCSRVGIND